jgi:hypothetical protein
MFLKLQIRLYQFLPVLALIQVNVRWEAVAIHLLAPILLVAFQQEQLVPLELSVTHARSKILVENLELDASVKMVNQQI